MGIYVQQNKLKDLILEVIFCFAKLKVRDIKYRILLDRFAFSTHTHYVKTSG